MLERLTRPAIQGRLGMAAGSAGSSRSGSPASIVGLALALDQLRLDFGNQLLVIHGGDFRRLQPPAILNVDRRGTRPWRHRGQASNDPATAIGNTGTWVRRASVQKPGLSGPNRPSGVRVPSGNTKTTSPRFNRRSVSFTPASPRPSRSNGMASSQVMSVRSTGTRNNESRASELNRRSHEIAANIGSRWL